MVVRTRRSASKVQTKSAELTDYRCVLARTVASPRSSNLQHCLPARRRRTVQLVRLHRVPMRRVQTCPTKDSHTPPLFSPAALLASQEEAHGAAGTPSSGPHAHPPGRTLQSAHRCANLHSHHHQFSIRSLQPHTLCSQVLRLDMWLHLEVAATWEQPLLSKHHTAPMLPRQLHTRGFSASRLGLCYRRQGTPRPSLPHSFAVANADG